MEQNLTKRAIGVPNNTTNKSKTKMIFQNFWTLLCCINIKVQRDFCPWIHEWYHISRISSLHQRATNGNLFWIDHGNNVIELYIIGNKRLMILHKKGNVHRTNLEFLFNREFNQRRNLVKNSFRILKKFFRKLLLKTNLHVYKFPIWYGGLLLYFVQHGYWRDTFKHWHINDATIIRYWSH
jgi:hypothetical protein